jgi:hypothetical protein
MEKLRFEVLAETVNGFTTWSIIREMLGYGSKVVIKNYINKDDVDHEVKYLLKIGYVDAGNYCFTLGFNHEN